MSAHYCQVDVETQVSHMVSIGGKISISTYLSLYTYIDIDIDIDDSEDVWVPRYCWAVLVPHVVSSGTMSVTWHHYHGVG